MIAFEEALRNMRLVIRKSIYGGLIYAEQLDKVLQYLEAENLRRNPTWPSNWKK